jgi:hypothetical protein
MTEGMGEHAPNISSAFSETAGRATSFLQSQMPEEVQMSPFSKPVAPSSFAEAKFKRAAEAVLDPVGVMSRIGDGSLTVADVQALNSVYPSLYSSMRDAVTSSMTNAVAKRIEVPYRSRVGASIFLGNPIDRTLDAASIANIQAGFAANAAKNQPQQQQKPGPKKSTAALSKVGSQTQTPAQAAESRRAKTGGA